MELDDDEAGGPGAECYLVPLWVFRLGKRDSLLVLKALGGRLTSKEAEEAKELGDRLTRQRANAARDLQAGAERAEASMKKQGEKP